MKVAIVGPGRLGGALARALTSAGHPVLLLGRKGPARAVARELELPAASFPLGQAEVVFLCVPDQAIAAVAAQIAPRLREGQVLAHCAGALDLEPLAPARRRGVHVGSLHPLCAVPSPLTSLEGAAAAVEGSRQAVAALRSLARSAGLKPFDLKKAPRPLYHAAAVVASNGLVALADASTRLFVRCGLDREQALDVVLALMDSALAGLHRHRLPKALTGPVARGDSDVICAHLDAIGTDEEYRTERHLYRALSFSLVRVSGAVGRAPPERLLELIDLLIKDLLRAPAVVALMKAETKRLLIDQMTEAKSAVRGATSALRRRR